MCGLVGVVAIDRTLGSEVLQNLLRLSAVRGLHATGVAWATGDSVLADVRGVPASEYCSRMPIFETKNLIAIGHCRYSTSGGKQHQPIVNVANDLAIAHNGVVSQEPAVAWDNLYGLQARTDNDSELLLHSRERNSHPLSSWPDASIAAVEVDKSGALRAYRNGKRPLYLASLPGLAAVASTKDILLRAGISGAMRIHAGSEATVRLTKGVISVEYHRVAELSEWCP